MRKLGVVVLSVMLVAGCGKSAGDEPAFTIDRTHAGSKAPFATFGYWGHPMLVALWKSDCAACLTQLTSLDKESHRSGHRIPRSVGRSDREDTRTR